MNLSCYKCWFLSPSVIEDDAYLYQKRYVVVDSPGQVKDGFWLDKDFVFARGGDERYWIPPNMIMTIICLGPDEDPDYTESEAKKELP